MPEELATRQWLILEQVPKLGVVTLARLLSACEGRLSRLFDLSEQALQQLGLTTAQRQALFKPDLKRLDNALDWLVRAKDHSLLTLDCPDYPQVLRELSRPPLLLFVRGSTAPLMSRQIAIVGSRNPSAAGRDIAHNMAASLCESGFTVTSGLAVGIDGCAHKGALATKGMTIAVLGAGLDNLYPKRHQKLAEDIVAGGGCVISEFTPGMPALAENFPRRNRIISGLSLGTLVVEAALKSGSLITARFALEQGRDVFAVPGSIHSPLSKGCHYLIKQGAKLVECVEDILEEYQTFDFQPHEKPTKADKKSEEQNLASHRLLDSVDFEVTSTDVIAQRSGIPVKVVLSELLEYELRGLVAAVPGGYVKLRGK
ncbi:DNA-processing protein DprA [Aliiglaciecola sp. CAU 1673]|uniref:DNA-processing protein DprA n=1 Tax=Aliiglaciecola sp. CAU 1673 TaxID=3032595 RepID=UPI0023DA32BA|nr:DNA-processing protein DprA [Aliiglaciecola sp. CAU 1673]MDF2179756.1 DNA-processing protein DprA [Aliiglaciecola sp. CAU 1673]